MNTDNGTLFRDKRPYKSYEVQWTIDVSAQSPEQAAAIALQMQRDPLGTATVFDVRCADDNSLTCVDYDPAGQRTTITALEAATR